MEPTSLPAAPEPTTADGHTRRSFVRGIAAAGASTAAAVALDRAGVLDLATADAQAAAPSEFSAFRALPASGADAFQVPEGYRADVIVGWGDELVNEDGTRSTYGFNNDFLAYFPLKGSDEGLLFVNHEYPSPLFIHGVTDPKAKTREQIALEQDAVGNAVVHVRRNADGVFEVVNPSPYNRRVTGAGPATAFTGPLAGDPALPGIGTSAPGSLANCSGGITPWGTALSCEENFQDYASTASAFSYGWTKEQTGTDDYYLGDGTAATAVKPGPNNAPDAADPETARGPAKYGWVVEHDPYDPSSTPRKHTALGRFRHENTAFRVQPGRPFVLYMGEDRTGGAVYKFVSDLPYRPGRRAENQRILESGTLYVARWAPEGRRRFATAGDVDPISATSGTGTWREVERDQLVDTYGKLRAALGRDEWDAHYATNRPEDLEVDEEGTVYIALTNNSDVKDTHGSIRTLREAGGDATATSFEWADFAAGGPSGRGDAGEQGFSSPDNLVFDRGGNLWVVTDISSSKLNDPGVPEAYHANNAVFMVPRTGPNAGVAFRFANMPIEAEGTGPYFTPDERTLFINVQHPGEESTEGEITSYWPRGNKTTGQSPSTPIPAMVAITKLPEKDAGGGGPVIPPPPPGKGPDGKPVGPPADGERPRVQFVSPAAQKLSSLRGKGVVLRMKVDEPGTVTVSVSGRLTSVRRGKGAKAGASARGRLQRFDRETVRLAKAGEVRVRIRPSARQRLLLRRETSVPALLSVRVVDAAGNATTRTKQLRFR